MTKEKRMQSKIAILIRVVIFLLIFACLLFYLFRVFDSDEEDQKWINGLYNEPTNTLDGVYIGTSAVQRYWQSPEAYHNYGMCIYNIGTPAQAMPLTEYIMRDMEKKQPDSDLYIIELRNAVRVTESFNEGDIRRITDDMPWSLNRIKAINATLDYYKTCGADINYTAMDYYVPFTVYHEKWNGGTAASEFKAKKEVTALKGYRCSGYFAYKPLEEIPAITGTEKLRPEAEDLISSLLDYCDTLDKDVLFVCSPFMTNEHKAKRLNRAVEMVKDRGYTVWDFNQEPLKSELDMDWAHNFKDWGHTNYYGARQYTDFLSKMIHESYELEDHRGEDGYESWDAAYEGMLAKQKEAEDAGENLVKLK